MNIRTMSQEERTILLNIIWKEKDTSEFKHAMVLYLSTMGMNVSKIAKIVHFDAQVVTETIRAFNDDGLVCIHPRYSEVPRPLAQPGHIIKKERNGPIV